MKLKFRVDETQHTPGSPLVFFDEDGCLCKECGALIDLDGEPVISREDGVLELEDGIVVCGCGNVVTEIHNTRKFVHMEVVNE